MADMVNLIEKLQKENENLKIDLEKANASIVDQTDKDNEIEHLENLLRGNLYDGYLYYKDIAREYQKNYALIEELKNKVAKRNNELIELEETSEKEFLTKQEVNENYIPKDKIREKIKELEKYIVETEEKTCGKCITIGEDMTIRYFKKLLEED